MPRALFVKEKGYLPVTSICYAMKKMILTCLALLLAFAGADARYNKAYYQKMDGKKKEELKSAVKQCVKTHRQLSYGQLPGYWQYTDVYPELVNGCKRWWDMYSNEVEVIGKNQNAFDSFRGYGMQREHSVPKSWWKLNNSVEYTPAYSDMWNLYPSNGAANQAKLNYPFGPTNGNNLFDNGCSRVGYAKAGYGGGSAKVFEPADEYKGDFARAMFYMACVYDDINWVINFMYQKNTYPTLVPWAREMLLQWSRTDKVSQKEIDRNNLVEQYQGNRNPFVDFPELAEYIWGQRTTETFIIDEQSTTDPTPPITGDPSLTQPVNGETLEFGETAVGYAVTRALQIKGSNFTSPLTVGLAGPDSQYFTPEVTEIPAATLNTNGGYLLNVTYLPKDKGSHTALLTLYDGGLKGSVAVTLTGSALDAPVLTATRALPATDITDNSYRANWESAPTVADYYVLTRVRYDGDNQESETYETGETTLLIEERDPAVAETYTVAYSRLGIMSPASNTIYVGTGDGVRNLEYNVPFRVYGEEGVLVILTGDGEPVRGVTVADMSGRVLLVTDAPDGTEISLPAGAYAVTAPGQRPRKVLVR